MIEQTFTWNYSEAKSNKANIMLSPAAFGITDAKTVRQIKRIVSISRKGFMWKSGGGNIRATDHIMITAEGEDIITGEGVVHVSMDGPTKNDYVTNVMDLSELDKATQRALVESFKAGTLCVRRTLNNSGYFREHDNYKSAFCSITVILIPSCARVYNGAEWVDAVPYVYDGTAWHDATPYVFRDGEWRD